MDSMFSMLMTRVPLTGRVLYLPRDATPLDFAVWNLDAEKAGLLGEQPTKTRIWAEFPPLFFLQMEADVIRCGFTNTCHGYAGSPSRSSLY